MSIALLDTNSFVAGVHVVPTPTGGGSPSGASAAAGTTVSSSNPKCAPFVTGVGGTGGAPGVTGYASITFQDDGDPAPFLVEEITTVGTPVHAAEALAALDASTHGCTQLTMKSPGARSSTFTVSPVTAPAHGDHATSARLLGTSGPMSGLHMTIVATGVQDAVLVLTFIQESESDIQGITESAVTRATAVFTYVKPA